MGYKKSISELVRDAQALRRMKEEYYAHLDEQKNERLAYYGRRMKGVSGSALSIIMDGMDQNKLILPHAKEHLKDTDGLVETKVNGVLRRRCAPCRASAVALNHAISASFRTPRHHHMDISTDAARTLPQQIPNEFGTAGIPLETAPAAQAAYLRPI